MHRNYYNVEVEFGEGLLLYNLLNKNFVYLEPEYKKFYLEQSEWDKDEKKLFEFVDAGFILPDNIDEVKGYLRNFHASRWNSRKLMFAFVPTTACNFRCIYCFEQGIKRKRMEREVLFKSIEFIKKKVEEFKPEEVEIQYYGGEPLLGLEEIRIAGHEIKDFLENRGIGLHAEIVTNGYLYDLKTAITLRTECGVDTAQITLDGPPRIHDARRPFNGDGKSFYVILRNIREIIEFTDIKMRIRVNVDRNNVPYLEELLCILSEFSRKENFEVYFSPVTGEAGDDGVYSMEEYGNVYVERILPLLKRYGFDYELYPGISYVFCAGITPFLYLIDADGSIKKCFDLVGRDEHSVGSVYDYRFDDVNVLQWEYFEPLGPECKKCKYLPVCGGGCPLRRMLTGKNHCEMWKFIMEKFLKKLYELKYEDEKVYR